MSTYKKTLPCVCACSRPAILIRNNQGICAFCDRIENWIGYNKTGFGKKQERGASRRNPGGQS